jgi:hypothetical protein
MLRALGSTKRCRCAESPYLARNERTELAQLLTAEGLNKLPELRCTNRACPAFEKYVLDPRRGIDVGHFVGTHNTRLLNCT